jgi:hypothetical protein
MDRAVVGLLVEHGIECIDPLRGVTLESVAQRRLPAAAEKL